MTTPHVVLYGKYMTSLLQGRVNMDPGAGGDPLNVMLTTNVYTPNQNTHQFKSDVIGEIIGSGYYSGGQTVTGISLGYNSTTRLLTVTGGNLVWPTATWHTAFAVLYMDASVGDTQKPLVGYMDFGGTIDVEDEAFYIDWPGTGIFTATVPT